MTRLNDNLPIKISVKEPQEVIKFKRLIALRFNKTVFVEKRKKV